jgi:hypothetical protein
LVVGLILVAALLPLSVSKLGGLRVFSMWAHRTSALLLAERGVALSSGLSPALPWILLATSALVVLYALLRRHRLVHDYDALENATTFRCGSTELSAHVDRIRDLLRASHPAWFETGIAFLLALLVWYMLVSDGVVTVDGRWFSWSLTFAYPGIVFGVAYLALFGWSLWQGLRRLLRALSWGPLAEAFDRIPPEFSRTLGLRPSAAPSAASELSYSLDQLSLLWNQARRDGFAARLAAAVPALGEDWPLRRRYFEEKLAEAANDNRWAYAYETKTQWAISQVAADLIREPLREAWEDQAAPAGRSAQPEEEGLTLAAEKLDNPRDVLRAVRRLPKSALRLAEDFVALEIGRFTGYLFRHLKNLLGAATVASVLLLFAAASYPFRPQHLLLTRLLVGFAVLLGLTTTILIQAERNEVLSRIANRTPGKVDFDAAFVGQLVTFLIVPIAAVLVTMFPVLSRPLGDMVSGVAAR